MSRARELLTIARNRVTAAIGTGTALLPESIIWLVVAGTISAASGQLGLFQSAQSAVFGFLSALLATAMIAIVILVHRLLARDIPLLTSSPALVIAFGIYGAMRLVMLGLLHEVLHLPMLYTMPTRIWAGALQGLVWVSFTSLYFASRERFLGERARLLDEQAKIEMRALQQSALSHAITWELAETVGHRLEASMSRSRALINASLDLDDSEQALRRVAASLRDAIDQDIRPISHALWAEAPSEQVKMTLPMLMRIGCYPRPYPIMLGLAVACLFVSPMALSMPHPGWALLMFIVQLASSGLVLALADRIVRTPKVPDPETYWTGLFTASVVAAIPPFVMPALGWTVDDSVYWAAFCSIGTAAIIVSTSMVTGLTGTRTVVLGRALASLSSAEVTQRVRSRNLAQASRVLARHLHSSLQGRLMAITLELEQAAAQNNREGALEALHRLDRLLETPLLGALDVASVQLDAGLDTLVREWSAVVDITLRLDVADRGHSPHCELILGIAEEAIANAVRHARASRVDIVIREERGSLVVRVENDGEIESKGLAGLGSRWLDAVSPDSWRLEPDLRSGHMVLEVRLPSVLPERNP